jgi:AcrR family transcriptional regulator
MRTARRKRPTLSSRKQPRQARSTQMVADILTASIRVLRRDGGYRFNTVRVAEEAGVSVGSLYQYFPNREALLFRLQVDEWQQTAQLLARLLGERERPPVERLRRTIVELFRSEAEEADLRRALDDASAVYRDSPEAGALRHEIVRVAQRFFQEALPRRARAEVAFVADFFVLTLSAIAEKLTARPVMGDELTRWSTATADLLCAHLERLQQPRRRAHRSRR